MTQRLDGLCERQASCSTRTEELIQEGEARYGEQQQRSTELLELREFVTCEAERANAGVAEVQEGLHSLRERTSAAIADVQKFMLELRASDDANQVEPERTDSESAECTGTNEVDADAALAEDADLAGVEAERESVDEEDLRVAFEHEPVLPTSDGEMREALERMIEIRLQESRANGVDNIADLERRLSEEWTGLRGWVDAAVVAVVNRISSLECTLHSEMAERSAALQEVTDVAAQSNALQTADVKRVQTELDKLVFEVRLHAVNNALRSDSAKAPPGVSNGDTSETPQPRSEQPRSEECSQEGSHAAPAGIESTSNVYGPPNPAGAQAGAERGGPATLSASMGSLQPSPRLWAPPWSMQGGAAVTGASAARGSSPQATSRTAAFPQMGRAQSGSLASSAGQSAAPVASQGGSMHISPQNTRVGATATSASSTTSLQNDVLGRTAPGGMAGSSPRANMPFMASVRSPSNGPHSARASPMPGAFASGAYQGGFFTRGSPLPQSRGR